MRSRKYDNISYNGDSSSSDDDDEIGKEGLKELSDYESNRGGDSDGSLWLSICYLNQILIFH